MGGIQTYGGVQHINKAVLHITQRKHASASKHTGGIQMSVGCPNMGGVITCGSPNIDASKDMGMSKHTGGIQTYRGHPNIWGCVQTYRRHPNIWGSPNIWGHTNMGDVQTYREEYTPIPTQHKESTPSQTNEVSICPHMFECSPVYLDAPICLDAT